MSLIKIKTGLCPLCDSGKEVPLVAGKCNSHYWQSRQSKEKKAKPVKPLKVNSISELIKLASIVFNRYIRERDLKGSEFFTCISCDKVKPKSVCQCGHYMPSTISALRFNEDNCHAECDTCNCNDPNHLIGYRKNLINKIGLQKVKWLEAHKMGNAQKWSREELNNIIKKYKN